MSDDNPEPRIAPRYIPTLTEVVHLNGEAAPLLQPVAAPVAGLPPLAPLPAQSIDRVMQQIDALLAQRLRDATSRLVARHTHQLLEQLRPELHAVVEQALREVLQQQAPTDTP